MLEMLIFFSACILFRDAEILLPTFSVSDTALIQDTQGHDTGSTDFWILEEMPSHLKLYSFAPENECLNTETIEVWVSFDDMRGCSDISLNAPNLTYQAYEQQFQYFNLPEKICGIDLVFGATSEGSFDDHVALALNNRLIYTSDRLIAEALSFSETFHWADIKEQAMGGELDPYCFVGCDEVYNNQANSTVSFEGIMAVVFDDAAIQEVLREDSVGGLMLYTFGDNDPADCFVENFIAYAQVRVPVASD